MGGGGCTQGHSLVMLLYNLENCLFLLPTGSAPGTGAELSAAGGQPPSPSAERTQQTSVHVSAAGIRSRSLGRDSCSLSPPFPFSTLLITWFASWLPSVLRTCVLRGVGGCLLYPVLQCSALDGDILDIRVYRQIRAVSKMFTLQIGDLSTVFKPLSVEPKGKPSRFTTRPLSACSL